LQYHIYKDGKMENNSIAVLLCYGLLEFVGLLGSISVRGWRQKLLVLQFVGLIDLLEFVELLGLLGFTLRE
jgi:hypothetical protein